MIARVSLWLLLACCPWAAAQEVAAQPAAAAQEAEALVAGARARLDAGEVSAAEKLVEAALVLAPADSEVRQAAEGLRAVIRLRTDAAAEVRLARGALLAGKYPEAESRLRRAITLLASESPERKKAEDLLDTVLGIRRQMAQLDEIERLLDERRYGTVSDSLKELVKNAKDGRVLQRAEALWERSHPGWLRSILDQLLRWFFDLAPYLAVVLLAMFWLWLRRVWNRWRKDRWRLMEVADSTKLGVGNLIVSYLSYWSRKGPASMTTGLLLLEASQIPLSPDFSVREKHFDFAKELGSVTLTVGGFNVGAFAKIVGILQQWLSVGRQEIRAMAYPADDKRLIARLTARYSADRVVTVTASAEKTDPDAARTVAEEVTFKMLYTIANNVGADEGDRAGDLRKGLKKLRAYVSGSTDEKPWKNLEEAWEIFAGVRKAWPDSLEAHLYEGIALDLLERHDEAIEHFGHVKVEAKANKKQIEAKKKRIEEEAKRIEEMRQRAAYNEAIANLRNLYQYEGIRKCIRLIDELTGESPDLEGSPIMALALAVKADAIASLTIPWYEIPDDEVFGDIMVGRTEDLKLKRIISDCITKVEAITTTLRQLLQGVATLQDSNWDADARRQLEWAIHNAEGDLYLYSLISLYQQTAKNALPQREEYLDLHSLTLLIKQATDKTELAEREEYLDKALSAFRRCEMLLPAGVETLSNLGTLFLFRGKPGDGAEAQRYFGRVIDLNPSYEYAYYRMAQSWEKERRRDKVIEVLKTFPNPPGIPSFQRMYKEYYVEPKVADALPGKDQPAPVVNPPPPKKAPEPAAGG